MNKSTAKQIAETITNEQLLVMFTNAKNSIKDWNKVSIVNKGMTKGTAWNILAKDFDINKTYHILAKTNMVREFGDYLPIKIEMSSLYGNVTNNTFNPIHMDPDFDNDIWKDIY